METYILDTNSLNYLNDILNYLKDVQNKLNNKDSDLSELSELNKFYSGALKSNELHNDIILELKEIITSINLENPIAKKMIDNIQKSLENKIDSLEKIVEVISNTIKDKEITTNDLEGL